MPGPPFLSELLAPQECYYIPKLTDKVASATGIYESRCTTEDLRSRLLGLQIHGDIHDLYALTNDVVEALDAWFGGPLVEGSQVTANPPRPSAGETSNSTACAIESLSTVLSGNHTSSTSVTQAIGDIDSPASLGTENLDLSLTTRYSGRDHLTSCDILMDAFRNALRKWRLATFPFLPFSADGVTLWQDYLRSKAHVTQAIEGIWLRVGREGGSVDRNRPPAARASVTLSPGSRPLSSSMKGPGRSAGTNHHVGDTSVSRGQQNGRKGQNSPDTEMGDDPAPESASAKLILSSDAPRSPLTIDTSNTKRECVDCGPEDSLDDFLARYKPTAALIGSMKYICVNVDQKSTEPIATHVRGYKSVCDTEFHWYDRLRRGYWSTADGEEREIDGVPQSPAAMSKRIIDIAASRNIKAGKWLLWVKRGAADQLWSRIARLTVKGELGCAASVIPANSVVDNIYISISIWTADLNDKTTAEETARRIEEHGFMAYHRYSEMSYRPEAFSLLGLWDQNGLGIPTALYCYRQIETMTRGGRAWRFCQGF